MEVSNLQKLNDDGYLYVPEIIIDPSNLYLSPPKDENNNNKTGALFYRDDDVFFEPIDEHVPTSFSRYRYPSYREVHELLRQAIENILQMRTFAMHVKSMLINI